MISRLTAFPCLSMGNSHRAKHECHLRPPVAQITEELAKFPLVRRLHLPSFDKRFSHLSGEIEVEYADCLDLMMPMICDEDV